jgi:hypothetical protein
MMRSMMRKRRHLSLRRVRNDGWTAVCTFSNCVDRLKPNTNPPHTQSGSSSAAAVAATVQHPWDSAWSSWNGPRGNSPFQDASFQVPLALEWTKQEPPSRAACWR